jgi:hypothetical protein
MHVYCSGHSPKQSCGSLSTATATDVISCKERVPTELLSLCGEGENVTIGNLKEICKKGKEGSFHLACFNTRTILESRPACETLMTRRNMRLVLTFNTHGRMWSGLENQLQSVLENGTD